MEAAQQPSQFEAGLRSEIERRHPRGVEGELEELRAEVTRLRGDAVELSDRLEEEAGAHVAARRELGRLEAALAQDPPRAAEPAAGHLVFRPAPYGYVLQARDGPAPDVGAGEDADGLRLRVVRVGRSPFPEDRRRCAFFEVA